MILLQIVLGYILADALSGLYHVLTDYGYNIQHQVKLFQYHHIHPETMTFDWQPFLAGLPIILLSFLGIYPIFFISLGVCLCLSQVAHLYCHRQPNKFIKFLQNIGFFIKPEHHLKHHSGNFDSNFCIFTGHNDIWLNPIINIIKKQR